MFNNATIFGIRNMKNVLLVYQKIPKEIKSSDVDRQEANKRGAKSRHRCGDIVIALRKREKDTHGS